MERHCSICHSTNWLHLGHSSYFISDNDQYLKAPLNDFLFTRFAFNPRLIRPVVSRSEIIHCEVHIAAIDRFSITIVCSCACIYVSEINCLGAHKIEWTRGMEAGVVGAKPTILLLI